MTQRNRWRRRRRRQVRPQMRKQNSQITERAKCHRRDRNQMQRTKRGDAFWLASVAQVTNALKPAASSFINVLRHQRRRTNHKVGEERLLIRRCHRLTHADIHLSLSLHSSAELSCASTDVSWRALRRNRGFDVRSCSALRQMGSGACHKDRGIIGEVLNVISHVKASEGRPDICPVRVQKGGPRGTRSQERFCLIRPFADDGHVFP